MGIKVFASGSCRILTTLGDGHNKITPLHSMIRNYTGPNFLGKLHNVKQHIQFIKFIRGELDIPHEILSVFLTSYNIRLKDIDDINLLPQKVLTLNEQFNECNCYIFEICSLKLYSKNNYQVQHEHTSDYQIILQNESELYNDLCTLRNLIPSNKKVIFQTHFRPNIIYNNVSKLIVHRTIIYNTVSALCREYPNTYIYDPSILIKSDHSFFDGDTHFTEKGYIASFNYLYNKYLTP